MGIAASHHQVHNKLTTLLILFVYLSVIDNRRSLPPRNQLLSSRSIVIAMSLRSSATMSLKTIIKLVQKLLSKNGSRHQSNPGATPLTILELLPSRAYNVRGPVPATFCHGIVYLKLSCRMRYSWDQLLDQSAGRRPTRTTHRLPITIVERPPRLRTMLPLSSPSFMHNALLWPFTHSASLPIRRDAMS